MMYTCICFTKLMVMQILFIIKRFLDVSSNITMFAINKVAFVIPYVIVSQEQGIVILFQTSACIREEMWEIRLFKPLVCSPNVTQAAHFQRLSRGGLV